MSDKVCFPYGLPVRSVWRIYAGATKAVFSVELWPNEQFPPTKGPNDVDAYACLRRLWVCGTEILFPEGQRLNAVLCVPLGSLAIDASEEKIREEAEWYIKNRLAEIVSTWLWPYERPKQVDKWQPWPKEKKGLCLPDEAWKRGAR